MPVQYDTRPAPSEEREAGAARDHGSRFNPSASRHNRPTVLVCDDEHIAAVAAQTLAELGVRVPGEVSLIGFNDTPRIAESLIPPLTTVKLPVEQLTAIAIKQLYLLHDEELPETPEARDIALPGQLVIRSSAAQRS